MAGYRLKTGKHTGATATKLSTITGEVRAAAVLITPAASATLYIGDSTVTSTTGLLLPSVGKDFPRMPGHDQYNLDEIYIIGATSGDIAYVGAVVGG